MAEEEECKSMRNSGWLSVWLLMVLFPLALPAGEAVRWIAFPDPALEVDGAPWFAENSPDLFRLPKRLETIVRKPVWSLAQDTSGVRIRFKSDCTTLGIRYANTDLSGMRNMHVFGQSGVDLYADGVYAGTAIHGASPEVEYFFFQNAPAQKREFVLYLPLYNGASVQSVGVNPECVVEKPAPFARPKPVVFYGTSITQGGCASRPGMSYEAILCRNLNLDFVNLGFSGNGLGEKEVAEAMAEIDASCFVLDFMANHKDQESLEAVYEPFARILREKHPAVPLVLVTRIYAARETPLFGGKEKIEAQREVIRKTAAKLITEGDRNITLVEGYDLLGPGLGDGLVDGTHPNDLGFQIMADRLAPVLARVLDLPAPKTN